VRSLIESRREVFRKPFESSFVRRVLAEIGGALDYIHSQGALHRDVKPANMLLTLSAPPILKLADFGMSKILQATSHARSIVGTQCYFSPELTHGQPYGSASDAWALGACLYELAALRRPFIASSLFALARGICEEEPPALPPETAPDIAQVIPGLLQKDPEQRLQLKDALSISNAVVSFPGCATSAGAAIDEQCRGTSSSPSLLPFVEPADGPVPEERGREKPREGEKDKYKCGFRWWSTFINVLWFNVFMKRTIVASKKLTIVRAFSGDGANFSDTAPQQTPQGDCDGWDTSHGASSGPGECESRDLPGHA